MAIDLSAPQSRRALLAAAFGGLAATAAQALARPAPAAATDGQPVIQGASNVGSASTLISSDTTTALQGLADAATGTAYGVRGRSNSVDGAGVVGQVVAPTGTNVGVRGLAASAFGIGVRGEAPTYGVVGMATGSFSGIGVKGTTESEAGAGVSGEATFASSSATGVVGRGYGNGVAGAGYGDGGKGVTGSAMGSGTTLGVLGTVSAATGTGVMGRSESSAATARAVFGHANGGVGVHGFVGPGAPPGASSRTGVYGRCDVDATSRGVSGYSAMGDGIYGNTNAGAAMKGVAASSAGFALRLTGRISFGKVSGVATIAANVLASPAIATGTDVTTSSYAIVSPQADPGNRRIWASLDTAANTVTIRTNLASGAPLRVAWLVVL